MTRLLRLGLFSALAVALVAWSVSVRSAGLQLDGEIHGIVSGPTSPAEGVTVNIIDSSGQIAGTSVTSAAGAYMVGNLPVGTYTIQAVSRAGTVLMTGTGTVSAGTRAVAVNLALTSGQLAAAAVGAGSTGTVGSTTAATVLAAGTMAATGGVLLHQVVAA
jgi:hypothetical protein